MDVVHLTAGAGDAVGDCDNSDGCIAVAAVDSHIHSLWHQEIESERQARRIRVRTHDEGGSERGKQE